MPARLPSPSKDDPALPRFTPIKFEAGKDPVDPYSRLLTTTELAKVLRSSWRAVYYLRERKLIPVVRLGRSVRFRLADVERALQRLTIKEVEL
jgi:excisionase family DNA binding protein